MLTVFLLYCCHSPSVLNKPIFWSNYREKQDIMDLMRTPELVGGVGALDPVEGGRCIRLSQSAEITGVSFP